jgi:hypothetical protein
MLHIGHGALLDLVMLMYDASDELQQLHHILILIDRFPSCAEDSNLVSNPESTWDMTS